MFPQNHLTKHIAFLYQFRTKKMSITWIKSNVGTEANVEADSLAIKDYINDLSDKKQKLLFLSSKAM